MSEKTTRLSRDDMRKQKALEEARKAGSAAPAVDAEGNEINPHIPQYIAQAPWYLTKDANPSLKHQRLEEKSDLDINKWYQRGAKKGPAATKFRKGACENCGAMTHKTKQCVDRPRKIGAKWTGKDIQADEVLVDFSLDYEGKHDRWNGYDPAAHEDLMEEYEKAEQERRRKRKEEELNKFMTEPDQDQSKYPHGSDATGGVKKTETLVDTDSDSDSEKDQENSEFLENGEGGLVVKKDPKTRTTMRNLRIREDTAKYLKNLDPNSAYYDPKSRSMKENPTPNKDDAYVGDGFVKASGDVRKFNEMQHYAWSSVEKGQGINMAANPSEAELKYREHRETKTVSSEKQKEELLAMYGGREHLENPDKLLLGSQTENFVVYAADGTVVRGMKDKLGTPKSKYEEDVYINNHTSVWGSYWENGTWGYACCHSVLKNSYCVGKVGIQIKAQNLEEMKNRTEQKLNNDKLKQVEEEENRKKEKKLSKHEREKEEKERVKKLEKNIAVGGEEEKDERKRAYNSFNDTDQKISDKDMEVYLAKKKRFDDPMANYVDKEDN